ncbi:MAG: leucyl aminopeptidase [Burkholderiales bacterium]
MDFSIKSARPESLKTECVAVPVNSSGKWTGEAQRIDRACKGQLTRLIESGDFEAKPGSTLMLYHLAGVTSPRVLLVGAGKNMSVSAKDYRDCVRATVRAASEASVGEVSLFFSDFEIEDRSTQWAIMQVSSLTLEATYRFDLLKSDTKRNQKTLKRVTVCLPAKPTRGLEDVLARGVAIGDGVNLARDLGNLPANFCTPTYLAQRATQLGRGNRLKITVLEQKDMRKLGMGALLSVAQGSRQPPKFIALEYTTSAKKQKPVVLVGKGITFDSGGISLKPSAEMDEMKYDMSGAGSVLGTMHAVSAMKLPLNVVGLIPTTENMPGGNATRPGDIVKSMSGQTIEILNTDAEGRLILCDALSYAERYEPDAVIDIATLTGACVIALGHVATGLFSTDDRLADELLSAGHTAWDRAWRMPVWDDYQDQLKSNFADMANIGGRPAGSITAACFLSRFAKKYRWAHLDIAGTAWRSGKEKGSTGRPVPLLTQFLMTRAGW